MKVIYDTATNELVGEGSDGISVEAPYAVADAPPNYKTKPMYFWKYNGVDAVELKTGQELADAQAKKDAEDAKPGQETKWKNNQKSLIAGMKGNAGMNDIRRAVKMLMFTVYGMHDEDDEV